MKPLRPAHHPILLLISLMSLWVVTGCGTPSGPAVEDSPIAVVTKEAEPAAPSEESILATRFGLQADSIEWMVSEGEVQSGQSLSHLLAPAGVSPATIHHIATEHQAVYDVRSMRVEQPWWMFRSASDSVARHFVYGINAGTYVVFDLTDSLGAKKGEYPKETVRSFVSGSVNGSLYQCLEDAGHSTLLAISMSKVYAWTIDFSRIQPGDHFRILYERDWVLGEPVNLPRIVAAEFVHRGRNFPAFSYDQGEGKDYFDETGGSLRKAFLKAPVEFSRISSHYNKKRFHPVLKRVKAHLGTDYAAPHGTEIVAVGDGVVTKSAYTSGNGKYVKIRHNDTYSTQYLHMSRRNVSEGQAVRQGDVIGYVGSTGLATGPHVCFRFWKNGEQVDHLKEDFPPSTPIREEAMADFKQLCADLMAEMASSESSAAPALASAEE